MLFVLKRNHLSLNCPVGLEKRARSGGDACFGSRTVVPAQICLSWRRRRAAPHGQAALAERLFCKEEASLQEGGA